MLFGNWQPKQKRLLEMSLRKEIYSFDSYIVRQGEQMNGLHFIIRFVLYCFVLNSAQITRGVGDGGEFISNTYRRPRHYNYVL